MISEVDLRDWGDFPKTPIQSKDEYEHFLKTHDWFFEMSEDQKVWRNGMAERTYLYEAQSLFDPLRELWKLYDKR